LVVVWLAYGIPGHGKCTRLRGGDGKRMGYARKLRADFVNAVAILAGKKRSGSPRGPRRFYSNRRELSSSVSQGKQSRSGSERHFNRISKS